MLEGDTIALDANNITEEQAVDFLKEDKTPQPDIKQGLLKRIKGMFQRQEVDEDVKPIVDLLNGKKGSKPPAGYSVSDEKTHTSQIQSTNKSDVA